MTSAAASGSDNSRRWLAALLVSFVVILIWSGYQPADRFIWILEATPAVIYAACSQIRQYTSMVNLTRG